MEYFKHRIAGIQIVVKFNHFASINKKTFGCIFAPKVLPRSRFENRTAVSVTARPVLLLKIGYRHWLCEIEALYHIASVLCKEIHLFLLFNALCDNAHIKAFCELNCLGYNHLAAVAAVVSAEELRVKL